MTSLTLLVALGLALALPAQVKGDLGERKAEFLKAPFLQKARWLTDYDQARKKAEQEGKIIFAYFTRSYAP